jgi:hypothetical protein
MTDQVSILPPPHVPKRDLLVATLYQQGIRVAEVADRAGVCVKTVRNIARRFGLPPRHPSQPERDAQVAARYKAGHKVAAIARDFGIARSRVRVIAARAGLPARSDWRRRYPLDEGAFDNPTDVGWWLVGLLAADGSINQKEQRVSLCQTFDDADVLHAFYEYEQPLPSCWHRARSPWRGSEPSFLPSLRTHRRLRVVPKSNSKHRQSRKEKPDGINKFEPRDHHGEPHARP